MCTKIVARQKEDLLRERGVIERNSNEEFLQKEDDFSDGDKRES